MPTDTESTLDILRRIEPVVHRIEAAQRDQGNRLRECGDQLREHGDRLNRLEGQISQIPTAWQMLGLFAGTNGFSVALVLGLAAIV